MTETLHITTSFVFPGGVAERDVGGKRRLVRVCVGMLECPERGLLAELEGTIGRIPWIDNAARTEAIENIKVTQRLDETTRANLARHITMSQYFEVRK